MTSLLMPTPEELGQIDSFASTLDGEYEVVLYVVPGSPWLIFHLRLWSWSGPPGSSPPLSRTYGLWRTTYAIYVEGPDGAMSDDEVYPIA